MTFQNRDFSAEFQFNASRSSGAGGQNVNKVNTKVELRFDINYSRILDEDEKAKLLEKLYSHITKDGVLIIVSQQERSQLKNKKLCISKFYQLLEIAFSEDKERIEYEIPLIFKEIREAKKRKISDKKEKRKKIDFREIDESI